MLALDDRPTGPLANLGQLFISFGEPLLGFGEFRLLLGGDHKALIFVGLGLLKLGNLGIGFVDILFDIFGFVADFFVGFVLHLLDFFERIIQRGAAADG